MKDKTIYNYMLKNLNEFLYSLNLPSNVIVINKFHAPERNDKVISISLKKGLNHYLEFLITVKGEIYLSWADSQKELPPFSGYGMQINSLEELKEIIINYFIYDIIPEMICIFDFDENSQVSKMDLKLREIFPHKCKEDNKEWYFSLKRAGF